MKTYWTFASVCMAGAFALAIQEGCTKQQGIALGEGLLKAKDIGCILTTNLTDSREVLTFCNLADELAPVVTQLVATKNLAAAHAAGASKCGSDAGPDGNR